MKCLKMFGLAAVAAMALMAFVGAGTASATKLCKDAACTEDLAKNAEVSASLTGSAEFKSGTTVISTCTGAAIAGTLNATSGTPLNLTITTLTFINCTKATNTVKKGTLAVEFIPGSDDGVLQITGTEITINSIFGTCTYGPIGILTIGSLDGGAEAKLEIERFLEQTAGGGGCPTSTRWTANFVVTTPASLYVGN